MSDFCPHHEQRGSDLAMCKANIESMDAWVAKVEAKMEAHHNEQLQEIRSLREEMARYKGAGWVLVKIGALVVGSAALAYYAIRIVKGG